MPAVSRAQWKFMQAVKHGAIHKPGLSPQRAAEFVDNVDYKSLPQRKLKKLGRWAKDTK